MKRILPIVSLLSITALAGCTTFPQPKDWPVLDPTPSIVAKARCETKFALVGELANVLTGTNTYIMVGGLKGRGPIYAGKEIQTMLDSPEQRSRLEQDIIRRLEPDWILPEGIEVDDLGNEPLKPEVEDDVAFARESFVHFMRTAISYQFELTAQETNDNTADFQFTLPFTNGTLGLGVVGGQKLDRKNKRKFRVQDSVSQLRGLKCGNLLSNVAKRGVVEFGGEGGVAVADDKARLYYPMTGSIGLAEIIEFYAHSVLGTKSYYFKAADNPDAKPKKGRGDFSEHTETVTFTTTVNGTLTPKLTFQHGTTGLDLDTATLTAKPMRIDTHQLVVSFVSAPPLPPLYKELRKKKSSVILELGPGVSARISGEGQDGVKLVIIEAPSDAEDDKAEPVAEVKAKPEADDKVKPGPGQPAKPTQAKSAHKRLYLPDLLLNQQSLPKRLLSIEPSEEVFREGLRLLDRVDAIPQLQRRLDELR